MVGVSGIVGSDRMVDRYSVHLSEGSADADARVFVWQLDRFRDYQRQKAKKKTGRPIFF
jgi:hypothetical protein